MTSPQPVPVAAIEAKLVILGGAGVGKTSLSTRLVRPNGPIDTPLSTLGASFVTKKLVDRDSGVVLRLQVWDTAGQERFRSISRLYYRGANAVLLCYSIIDQSSFEEMQGWLREIRENVEEDDVIVHIVGTKSDQAAEHRQVPLERAVAFLAEQVGSESGGLGLSSTPNYSSPGSKRSSVLYLQDEGWDSCSEVSAWNGEGVDELFRIVTRKLVEQHTKREVDTRRAVQTPGMGSEAGSDHFHATHKAGSFRLGHGDRRSWLGLPGVAIEGATPKITTDVAEARRKGRCC